DYYCSVWDSILSSNYIF
nr:immunoglobulin light chain junction region [Macaca mulatta]MOW58508.1 immunoglobulin light chain junction region [Macaca mulatta]MOW58852.1 immunoglobulin light chain junction region [Macaca mulatta]MOW59550.1 immunoglobulin light chain junction region [Macaca mulatta]